jgi:fucose 4-O-acetylase-like acetyltransferase
MKERELGIDILRGLAILFVLLGHMIPWEGVGHDIIYSFHVPLFFFLSGYLMHKEIDAPRIIISRSAKRLLIPYALTVLAMAIWALIKAFIAGDWNEIPKMLLSYLWGGNVYIQDCIPMGPIWFLLTLFWAKSILVLLIKFLRAEWVLLTALVISFIGFALNDYRVYVPFQIILSLQVIVMMAMGWYWKHFGFPNWFNYGSIIIWIVMIFIGKMDVFTSTYSYAPLNIMGAFGASFILMNICHMASQIQTWIITPFAWIGKNSLLLLCCHQLECFSGVCITAWIQWQIHYFIPAGWCYLVHIGINLCMVGACLLFGHLWQTIVGSLRKSKQTITV